MQQDVKPEGAAAEKTGKHALLVVNASTVETLLTLQLLMVAMMDLCVEEEGNDILCTEVNDIMDFVFVNSQDIIADLEEEETQ